MCCFCKNVSVSEKLDGVNVGAHESFTPSELLGGLRCPAVIVNQKWKGQSKIVGGAARWTAVELDGQLTFISAHLPHKGKKLGEFEAALMEIQEFLNGRPKHHVILGGDFNVNLFGMTDFPCGRVDSETENVGRHERFTASESFTHDGDRTGLDGDKHVDERRHRTRAFHAFQLVKPRRLVDTSGLHHDFEKTGHETSTGSGLRLVQDRSQSGACSSFVETENEVHDEERCKPAWLGARRFLTQSGCRNADGLAELEHDGTSAFGNGGGSQKIGNQGDVSDRIGAQITSAEKEENRTVPRAIRIELALSRNLEKEKSVETRETLGQDQGECGDGESTQENAKQAFQLELDLKRRKSRICSHKILPRPLLDSGRPGGVNPIRETTLGGAVEKHENGLCWWNVDLAKETGKCLEETEKRERVTGSNHGRCFESISSRMFGTAGEGRCRCCAGTRISGKTGCAR